MECRLRVVLGVEGDVETGLNQREAEQFAFAWAVFDQENGGVRHHIYRGTSAGTVPGSKMSVDSIEVVGMTVSYDDEGNVIDDYDRRSELGRNSREEGRNSRGTGRAAWLLPCAHGTPTMKRIGMTPVLIPCSRSAHDQNVLARRPQWDQHGCHSKRAETS